MAQFQYQGIEAWKIRQRFLEMNIELVRMQRKGYEQVDVTKLRGLVRTPRYGVAILHLLKIRWNVQDENLTFNRKLELG